jgi:hypothetical protein
MTTYRQENVIITDFLALGTIVYDFNIEVTNRTCGPLSFFFFLIIIIFFY